MPPSNACHLAESLGHLDQALVSFAVLVDAAAASPARAAAAKAVQREAADAEKVLGDLQLFYDEMTDIAIRLGAAAYHWQKLPETASSD